MVYMAIWVQLTTLQVKDHQNYVVTLIILFSCFLSFFDLIFLEEKNFLLLNSVGRGS